MVPPPGNSNTFSLELHPVLNSLLHDQALVGNISIVGIIPVHRPGKGSRVPFGGWNKAT